MSIFKSHIDLMSPYKPPLDGRDPSKYTLLDFNERTVPVSSLIAQDIAEWVLSGRMQMYPSYGDIETKIANYCGVAENNVAITNGSDQGIDLIFRMCCREGDEVIIPGPTFPMYGQSASAENAKILSPQYTFDSGYPLEECIDLVNERTRVIVVSNPNNPSGTSVKRDEIIKLAQAAPKTVILVDECYFEYCKITVTDVIEQYPNIIVTRTFSKTWGLPSLRIGYVVASAENIEALCKVRGPYDINQIAVVAVESALNHQDEIRNYIDEVMQKSKPMLEHFLRENNIKFWPSDANFIWAFFEDAEAIEFKLRSKGILVRRKADSSGEVGLRMTLGTEEQTRHLLEALNEIQPGRI